MKLKDLFSKLKKLPKGKGYRDLDLDKLVLQDIQAAIAVLDIIVRHPDILKAVVVEVEKIRERIIANEERIKAQGMAPSNGKAKVPEM